MNGRVGAYFAIALAAALPAVVAPPPVVAQIALETTQRLDVFIEPSDIGAGDFDGDGALDLLYAGLRGSLLVLPNDGAGQFRTGASTPFDQGSARVVIGDLNGDGHSDVASAESSLERIVLRYGAGDGRLPREPSLALPVGGAALDAFAADVDLDGDVDLVAVTPAGLAVFLSEGPGVFARRWIAIPALANTDGAIVPTDFDSDGIVDAVVARDVAGRPAVGSIALLRGRGDGLFDVAQAFDVFARGTHRLVADDFNGDGRADLAVASFLAAGIRVYLGGIGGSFGPESVVPFGNRGFDVASGDLDSDGRLDLVAMGKDEIGAFRGDGRGGFQEAVALPAQFQRSVAGIVRDFDGDGLPEIATADGDSNRARVAVHANRSLPSCRGTVNEGAGDVTDVLFVNDSTGGDDGTVRLVTYQPLTISMSAPPLAVGPSPFVLFAWREAPAKETRRDIPHGIGRACLPMLRDTGPPLPVVVWNNLGKTAFAPPTHPSAPAPSIVLQRPSGLGRPATFFLQGLILDPGSAGTKPASVTNGILVEIR